MAKKASRKSEPTTALAKSAGAGVSASVPLSLAVSSGQLAEIEDVIAQCELSGAAGTVEQGLRMAAGIRRLDELITDEMMADVMALQGRSLGFRTDKDKTGGYDVETVKRCFIEARLRGARPVNNEFNVISAQPYLTKNYFSRAVREWPGLTNLRLMPQVPALKSGGALVPYRATWLLDGEMMSVERLEKDGEDRRIAVRVNAGMGTDAIIGKATRKILAEIYGILTGTYEAVPEGEVEAIEGRSGRRLSRSDSTDTVAQLEGGETPQLPAASAAELPGLSDGVPAGKTEQPDGEGLSELFAEYQQKILDAKSKADLLALGNTIRGDARLDGDERLTDLREFYEIRLREM